MLSSWLYNIAGKTSRNKLHNYITQCKKNTCFEKNKQVAENEGRPILKVRVVKKWVTFKLKPQVWEKPVMHKAEKYSGWENSEPKDY